MIKLYPVISFRMYIFVLSWEKDKLTSSFISIEYNWALSGTADQFDCCKCWFLCLSSVKCTFFYFCTICNLIYFATENGLDVMILHTYSKATDLSMFLNFYVKRKAIGWSLISRCFLSLQATIVDLVLNSGLSGHFLRWFNCRFINSRNWGFSNECVRVPSSTMRQGTRLAGSRSNI